MLESAKRGRPRLGLLGWALLGSAALHASVGLVLHARPKVPHAEPERERISVELRPQLAPEPAPPLPQPLPSASASPAPAPRGEPRIARAPTPSAAPSVSTPPSPPAVAPVPSVPGTHPGDPRRAPVDRVAKLDLAPRPPSEGLPDLSFRGTAPPPARIREDGNRLWVPGLDRPLQRQSDGSYTYQDRQFEAEVRPDGTVAFDGHAPVGLGQGGTIMTFDVTEAVMMAAGEDPARYLKGQFLGATAALRQKLCDADRQEKGRRALQGLNARLESLWSDRARSPIERRRMLFEEWDGCLEASDDQAKLGAMARAVITGFIRRVAPPGSAEAYGAEELAELNATRKSSRPFEPYAAETTRR